MRPRTGFGAAGGGGRPGMAGSSAAALGIACGTVAAALVGLAAGAGL
jgi:hypothetical protein